MFLNSALVGVIRVLVTRASRSGVLLARLTVRAPTAFTDGVWMLLWVHTERVASRPDWRRIRLDIYLGPSFSYFSLAVFGLISAIRTRTVVASCYGIRLILRRSAIIRLLLASIVRTIQRISLEPLQVQVLYAYRAVLGSDGNGLCPGLVVRL